MKTSDTLVANGVMVAVVASLRCPGVLMGGDRFTIAVHEDRIRVRIVSATHPVDPDKCDTQLDTSDPCLVFDAVPFMVALVMAE